MRIEFVHALIALGAVLAASLEAIVDEYVSRTRKIEHKLSASIRFIVIMFINFYLFNDLWYPILHSVIDLFFYWFTMDSVWGYRRLGNWFYVGETAELDKLCRATLGNSTLAFIFFKVFCTLALVIPLYFLSM